MPTVPFTNAVLSGELGVDVTLVDDKARFPLGKCVSGERGSMWVYMGNGVGVITGKGYVCGYNADFDSVAMLTTANSDIGAPIAVAMGAVAANKYAWYQCAGITEVRGAAAAAANARLNTTATAGQVDDDGTVGARVCDGFAFVTVVGGAAANQTCWLVAPKVGVQL